MAKRHTDIARTWKNPASRKLAKQAKGRYEDKQSGLKNISREINMKEGKPMLYVRRDVECTDGDLTDTMTLDPKQNDGVTMAMWNMCT